MPWSLIQGLDSHHGVSFAQNTLEQTSFPAQSSCSSLKLRGYPLSSSVLLPPQSAFQQVLSSLPLKRLNPSSSSLHGLSLTGSQGVPCHQFSMEAAEVVSLRQNREAR